MPIIVLQRNPGLPFRQHLITTIYFGPNGDTDGVIVPNPDDLIIDYENSILYRVISIDDATEIPTLERVYFLSFNESVDNANVLKQRGVYQPHILQRVFVNTSVSPFTFSIDDRYTIRGSEAYTAKAFKGYDTTEATGIVISQRYDASGSIIGDDVPLIRTDNNSDTEKRAAVFYSQHDVADGEIVSLLIYSHTGHVLGSHPFIVVKSNVIRRSEFNEKLIVNVALVSQLLDPVQQDLINAPANVNLTGGDFRARLDYSDGSTSVVPVDGIKTVLHGLQNFNTSQAGNISKVVLTYYPNSDEPIINTSNTSTKQISSVYRIGTVDNISSNSFKIYAIPIWHENTDTYSLKYYMTNLEYNTLVLIPSGQISVTKDGGGAINFTQLAETQTIQLAVILSDLFPLQYPNQTFVQMIKVNFGGKNTLTPWVIDYIGNGEEVYGTNVKFEYSEVGYKTIDLKNGCLTKQQWLDKLWTPLHAIHNPDIGFSAPVPTAFKLRYAGMTTLSIPVDNWNVMINDTLGVPWVNHSTIEVIWVIPSVTLGEDLVLGVSPVMITNTL